MSKFMRSFNEAFNAGNSIVDAYRNSKQRDDFKKIAAEDQVDTSQYNPEDFTDDAEKAGGTWSEADQAFKLPNGGLQAPTNTPTWDAATNSYQGAQGQSLKPKAQFTLGGQTQAARFTPDQVQDYRNNRYADVYAANGDIDKALGVRASAQTMKLGKVQLDQAELVAKEVKYEKDLRKIMGDRAMGKITDQEAINLAINISDKAGDPAQTFGYKDLGDGKYDVGMLKDNRFVGSETLNVDQILQKAYENATPTLRAQATEAKQRQDIADRTFQAGRDDQADTVKYRNDTLTQNQNQFDDTLTFNKGKDVRDAAIKEREIVSLDSYRKGSLARQGSGGGLNEAQKYRLEREKKFDAESEAIAGRVQRGEISDVVGSRMLKIIGAKYGASGGPLQESKGITLSDRKAAEEVLRLQDPNFDAMPKASQDEARNALLGIAPLPVMQTAPPPADNGKTGGLQPAPKRNWYEKAPPTAQDLEYLKSLKPR